jgi:hypothetical protein
MKDVVRLLKVVIKVKELGRISDKSEACPLIKNRKNLQNFWHWKIVPTLN